MIMIQLNENYEKKKNGFILLIMFLLISIHICVIAYTLRISNGHDKTMYKH